MGAPVFAKRVDGWPQFRRILGVGAGYIYNGSTRDEAVELGFDEPTYGKLHAAHCHTLSSASANSKWFFPRLNDAHAWLAREVGERQRNWNLCSFCYPTAPEAAEFRPLPEGIWRRIESSNDYNDARAAGCIFNGPLAEDDVAVVLPGKLHRAGCTTLDLSGYRRKTWFSDLDTAESWLDEHVGAEGEYWQRCSICHPMETEIVRNFAALAQELFGDEGAAVLTTRDGRGEESVEASPAKVSAARPEADSGDRFAESDDRAGLHQEIEELRRQLLEAQRDRDALAATVASLGTPAEGPPSEQFEAAWESAVQENYELQATLAALRAEVEALTEDRDAARLALEENDGVAARDGGEAAQLIAVELYQFLRARTRLSQSARLEIVDALVASAGPIPSLLVERGVLLSAEGRDEEAVAALADAAKAGEDQRVVDAYVNSNLRLSKLPEPAALLSKADWSRSSLADEAVKATAQLRPAEALELARQAGASLSLGSQARLFEVLADRQLSKDAYRDMIDLWETMDPPGAARELLRGISMKRTSLEQPWTRRKLVTLALADAHEDDAERAAKLLLRHGRSTGQASGAAEVAVWASSRPDSRSALQIRDEALRLQIEFASMSQASEAAIEACGLASVWQLRGEQELANSLAAAVESGLGRVSEDLRDEVRAEIARLRLVNATPSVSRVMPVTTVREALEFAAQEHPALVVLDDARASAAGASGNVSKVLEGLRFLGECADRYATSGGNPYTMLGAGPVTFKPDISDTAKQKYRAAYERVDDQGRSVLLGPHLVLGNKSTVLRVYFHIDTERCRFVIGHVGSHLPDKSS